MKQLTKSVVLLIALCMLCACGIPSQGNEKPQDDGIATNTFSENGLLEGSSSTTEEKVKLKTDTITVYEIGGRSWEVTDGDLLEQLVTAAIQNEWVVLTDLKEQVPAEPVYIFDFHNGTVVGLLGEGYVDIGTSVVVSSEESESFSIENGVQYQVNLEFTDALQMLASAGKQLKHHEAAL